ncbi:hypothetical protein PVAND_016925 [Polypedilum vanderplanki]|uniref:C2H2-type domain-containing protein n=1 Tax=Polypedilum vanderplanki TaxID=319348 RepID=A0A9J6BHH1_POLVA|nr:hypothetical protein PVAND_016925 [Polypedilum vanderplanki]
MSFENFKLKTIKQEDFNSSIKNFVIKIKKLDPNLIIKEEKFEEIPVVSENQIIKQEPEVEFELQLPEEEENDKKSRNFVCKTCNIQFDTLQRLNLHQRTHNDPIKCKKCEKTFKIIGKLKQHQCMFQCKICLKDFLRRDNLNQHVNYVHEKWKESQLFTCDHCGKGFKYLKSLVCHMKQHMKVKPFVCEICNQGFSVINTFRQHKLTHGGKIPCKICKKMLKPSAVYYHMKQSHENDKKISCNFCDLMFKTKSDLANHLLSHNKKFDCSLCGKSFNKANKLKEHLLSHADLNAFKCNICNKNFAQSDCLEKHKKIVHEDGKAFRCTKCGFTTNIMATLLKHTKGHKNDEIVELLSCKLCDEMFVTKISLKNHVSKIHNK